jgi:hypothetical protein
MTVDAAFWTITVSIDSAVCIEFIEEFRSELFVEMFRNIAESVLESDLCLFWCETETTGWSSADAFDKLRIFRKFVRKLDCHSFIDVLISHCFSPYYNI